MATETVPMFAIQRGFKPYRIHSLDGLCCDLFNLLLRYIFKAGNHAKSRLRRVGLPPRHWHNICLFFFAIAASKGDLICSSSLSLRRNCWCLHFKYMHCIEFLCNHERNNIIIFSHTTSGTTVMIAFYIFLPQIYGILIEKRLFFTFVFVLYS